MIINTEQGQSYCVTISTYPAVISAIKDDRTSVTLVECNRAGQFTVIALSSQIEVTDEAAIVTKLNFNGAPSSQTSGGGIVNVAKTDAANIYTKPQTFNAGVSLNGGASINGSVNASDLMFKAADIAVSTYQWQIEPPTYAPTGYVNNWAGTGNVGLVHLAQNQQVLLGNYQPWVVPYVKNVVTKIVVTDPAQFFLSIPIPRWRDYGPFNSAAFLNDVNNYTPFIGWYHSILEFKKNGTAYECWIHQRTVGVSGHPGMITHSLKKKVAYTFNDVLRITLVYDKNVNFDPYSFMAFVYVNDVAIAYLPICGMCGGGGGVSHFLLAGRSIDEPTISSYPAVISINSCTSKYIESDMTLAWRSLPCFDHVINQRGGNSGSHYIIKPAGGATDRVPNGNYILQHQGWHVDGSSIPDWLTVTPLETPAKYGPIIIMGTANSTGARREAFIKFILHGFDGEGEHGWSLIPVRQDSL